MSKITVILELFLLGTYVSYVFSECNVTMDALDECGTKTSVFGDWGNSPAKDMRELDLKCDYVKENGKCVFEYIEQCLTGFVKQAMLMSYNTIKKHINLRCDVPEHRQDFLTHVKCMTVPEKQQKLRICYEKHAVMMTVIKRFEFEDRVPAICCAWHSFQDCFKQTMLEICSKESTEYWEEVLNDIASDTMSISCSNYDTLDQCDKSLDPDHWKTLKAEAASNDTKVLSKKIKYKSMIALTVDLIEN